MSNTLCVIGAGQMGTGIAQTALAAGWSVQVVDAYESAFTRSRSIIDKGLAKWAEKGLIDAEIANNPKLSYHTAIDQTAPASLYIEAASEQLDIKLNIFRALDQHAPDDALLCSNTSSISITTLAAATSRPASVVGMHFFNPVPLMKLVEVIPALQTDSTTTERVIAIAEAWGKTAVEAKDSPGFVSNRVLMPMINEAIGCLHEGVANAEGIDQIMHLGMAHPMGPLALADLIGLDTCLSILDVLHEGFGDPRYRPSPLLKQMVDAGYLGKKVGRGFYHYEG